MNKKMIPGILLCFAAGYLSTFIAASIPLGGVPVAIILGILSGNLLPKPELLTPGFTFSEKHILAAAIALMGLGLDYRLLLSLGLSTVFIIILGMLFTISFSLFLGKMLGCSPDQSLLLGIGNGVCGSSAIAASQGVIKAREEYVGIAIAIVNLLGTVGIFLLPAISLLLPGFTELQKGILIGNTLQAVGQVTAAGFCLGSLEGETATIVKMGRILLLTPIVLALNLRKGKIKGEKNQAMALPRIPWYILVFVLLSIITSTGFVPQNIIHGVKILSKRLLVTAMFAIGMKIGFKELIRSGGRALSVGILTFGGQILFSMGLISLFSRLF